MNYKKLDRPQLTEKKFLTPYFEKRNIYFYINQCGFHAAELYEDMKALGEDSSDREEFGMFRFEKVMRQEMER